MVSISSFIFTSTEGLMLSKVDANTLELAVAQVPTMDGREPKS